MTANLENFTRELDELVNGRVVHTSDPTLQAANVLLAIDLDSESSPPADLRARWISRMQPPVERNIFLKTLNTRPVLAILLALLILLTLSGVAYAIGRSLGYIPGIGMVDQSMPVRVLAHPVTVTRDGITITITDAVLSSDKTILRYSIENLPNELTAHEGDTAPACIIPTAELRQGDGAVLVSSYLAGLQGRLVMDPIPANVNDAILSIPCIPNAFRGLAPENWEISLAFVPAPPDMTALPVVEYTSASASIITPSAEAVPAAESTPSVHTDSQQPNPISISKVIDTGNSYILLGTFRSPTPEHSSEHRMKLLDANGDEVPWNAPTDVDPEFVPGAESWVVEFDKIYPFPIRIAYSELVTSFDPSKLESEEFEFDAGLDSQIGDTWEINRDITLTGYTFSLDSISIEQGGGCAECAAMFEYTFHFTSPEPVQPVDPFISDFENLGLSFAGLPSSFRLSDGRLITLAVEFEGYESNGGSGSFYPPNKWEMGDHQPNLLRGKVKVKITLLPGTGEIKNWTLDWQPDTFSASIPPQTCLTVDSWKAAVANPQPILADLPGKVFLQSSLDNSNSSIYVANPDGSNKQEIGYVWNFQPVSSSPDGSQVLFSQEDGLYVKNIATGEMLRIPNTLPSDFFALWSPDGMHIAFLRTDNQTSHPNIYLINPNGTDTQKITKQDGDYYLLGWLPDGSALFFTELTRDGYTLKKLELASGTISEFFAPKGGHIDAINSDGNEVVFQELIDGTTTGLFISRIDGSDRRLIASASILADPEGWGFGQAKWSPDGKWLTVVVYVTTANTTKNSIALVNPATCQIVPLPYTDNILAWIR